MLFKSRHPSNLATKDKDYTIQYPTYSQQPNYNRDNKNKLQMKNHGDYIIYANTSNYNSSQEKSLEVGPKYNLTSKNHKSIYKSKPKKLQKNNLNKNIKNIKSIEFSSADKENNLDEIYIDPNQKNYNKPIKPKIFYIDDGNHHTPNLAEMNNLIPNDNTNINSHLNINMKINDFSSLNSLANAGFTNKQIKKTKSKDTKREYLRDITEKLMPKNKAKQTVKSNIAPSIGNHSSSNVGSYNNNYSLGSTSNVQEDFIVIVIHLLIYSLYISFFYLQ